MAKKSKIAILLASLGLGITAATGCAQNEPIENIPPIVEKEPEGIGEVIQYAQGKYNEQFFEGKDTFEERLDYIVDVLSKEDLRGCKDEYCLVAVSSCYSALKEYQDLRMDVLTGEEYTREEVDTMIKNALSAFILDDLFLSGNIEKTGFKDQLINDANNIKEFIDEHQSEQE